jgi:hypothetical protein
MDLALSVGRTYTDGWGKKRLVTGISATNPEYWVVTDPQGMFRVTDGRKCIFYPQTKTWRCPDRASRWDLDVNSGS